MAPIIVKPPNPDDFIKVKCGKCFATVGYVPAEVQSYSGTDYSGGPDGREWIVCPNCGKEITLRSW